VGARENLVGLMISNFEKFNSNTGWTDPSEVFTLDRRNAGTDPLHIRYNQRQSPCLRSSGWEIRDGFIITDSVIMCMNQAFGPTDLGSKGIATFFACHR
jgi:hypothetical protein